ncbi:MAG: tetratricopeptide repeat-containing sulfotransferase family protein [Steroidobacteraceae bacterium]
MVNTSLEPLGTVQTALDHAFRLLETRPALAAEQANEILKAVPQQREALLLLGVARRKSGQTEAALAVLRELCEAQPRWALAHRELGETLAAAGRSDAAVAQLRHACALQPNAASTWLALGGLLIELQQTAEADGAFAHYLKAAPREPELQKAGAALLENRVPEAEALLRSRLQRHPNDVAALRMLAEVAARLLRYRDAQMLLEHCLSLAPGFDAARHNYATVLNRQGRAAEAREQCTRLLAREPRNPGYRSLYAAISASLGEYAEAITSYESVLSEYPRQPKLWLSYGHALKTTGKVQEGIAAYRRALSMEPTLGEAWWSLANLKTFHFSEADVLAMRQGLARADLTGDDRLHFEFALGKALEDSAAYEESFAHYAAGNTERRRVHGYDPEDTTRLVRGTKELFTREFLAERAGAGAQAADPIFIVGLPRAGSTLIEQILASHPLVEGTMELPAIPKIARELAGAEREREEAGFLETIASLTREELRALGERYLAETRPMRKTDAPLFIDKMPNNCVYVGLIHLILPNAVIIDARRHPLACCLSCYKQHFARGQWFTYALEDLGRYYRDYVALMAHFDAVLPGRVGRVFYEDLIEDTETQVRRLLAHCRLPYDARCLRFYENDRAVRTASSEQVRQPIFRDGTERWRHYEPWLGPLKSALGEVLTEYPRVPQLH